MRAPPTNVAFQKYLTGQPDERARILSELRKTILHNLPTGFAERFERGILSYVVPLSEYPATYNGQPLLLAALASQKAFVTLYLMAATVTRDWRNGSRTRMPAAASDLTWASRACTSGMLTTFRMM